MGWPTTWMLIASIEGNGYNAVATDPTAQSASGLSWQTIVSGLIGGLVVAVVNHFFTLRRERSKWLRELQVKANQNFYASAQELISYVVDGHDSQPLTPGPDGSSPDQISIRRTSMNRQALNLIPVAPQSTITISGAAGRILPQLAYLAVPLSGNAHAAAMTQQAAMLAEMSNVLQHVGLVMRDDVGLIGWRGRNQVRKSYKKLSEYRIHCPIDELDLDGIRKTLWDWRVRAAISNEVPATLDGYRTNAIPVIPDPFEPVTPQAFAAKYRDRTWQLVILPGLTPEIEMLILRDVLRVVVGNIHGFDTQHNPKVTKLDPSTETPGVGFMWHGVETTEAD